VNLTTDSPVQTKTPAVSGGRLHLASASQSMPPPGIAGGAMPRKIISRA